ncbi:MAG: GNAT family acetyltransferase [Pseudomonadota bacterium]
MSKEPFTIRVYQDQDHSGLIELWETCFPDDPPWNDPVEIIKRKRVHQPEQLYVCINNGNIIGSVLAGFDGFRGWINKLATHPDYQHQGVATLLLNTAEHALAAMGCPKINLQVRQENSSVVQLYENAGYEIEALISMGKLLPENTTPSIQEW